MEHLVLLIAFALVAALVIAIGLCALAAVVLNAKPRRMEPRDP